MARLSLPRLPQRGKLRAPGLERQKRWLGRLHLPRTYEKAGTEAGFTYPSDLIGRGERIRTSDSCVPNAVLYQAELHPDCGKVLWLRRLLLRRSMPAYADRSRVVIETAETATAHAAGPNFQKLSFLN